jgi:hypothetical protein
MTRRALGAVLALIALAGVPLRTLAACTMPAVTVGAPRTVAPGTTDAGGAGQHAHHAGAGLGEPRTDDSSPTGTPVHEGCPDLASCAVAAIPAARVLTPEASAMSMAPHGETLASAPSFRRSVDPPPPKA